MLLTLSYHDQHKFYETVETFFVLENTLQLRQLNPYLLMSHFLIIAQCYVQFNEVDKAINYLTAYVELVKQNVFPIQLKGNEFFDLIDP